MTSRARTFLTAALAVVALGGCKNRTNRIPDTLPCTAGETVTIGCTHDVGTPCQGDPVLDVCEGTVAPGACTSANAIAHNDDFDGLCPEVTATCSANGRITIAPSGFMGRAFDCYYDLRHGGAPPPPDAGSDAGATPPGDGG
jgi:hypothetical protein